MRIQNLGFRSNKCDHQSLTDRTLDQQCTVTRPGIAAIASGLLVEIFVSILQHPLGILAPAPLLHTEDRGLNPLGLVPHQIRGFLSAFQNILIKGMNYDCCSACSENVVNAYKSGGWSFVKRALDEQGFLEEVSGLAQVSVARIEFGNVTRAEILSGSTLCREGACGLGLERR